MTLSSAVVTASRAHAWIGLSVAVALGIACRPSSNGSATSASSSASAPSSASSSVGPSTTKSGGATRSFEMGFTPWPFDATPAAIDATWSAVHANGDLVSQHLEEGVPWPEAASGAPFPPALEALLADRKRRANGARQLLALNPLDLSRTRLAALRTEKINAPLTAPWSGYALDDPAVIAAYLAYVKRVADALEPAYIQTGVEVNLLRRDVDAAAWARLVRLQCAVYQGLKAARYTQPISVSFVSTPFYKPEKYDKNPDVAGQIAALRDIEPCVDMIAWSVYPFVSGLLAESIPDDYFASFLDLTTKPQAISESGYPAESWSLPGGPTWSGTPEKQRRFTDLLLGAAASHALRFVIWFTTRDYDALWARPPAEGGLGKDSLSLVWRDTGLLDASGAARPALARWRDAFSLRRE